MFSNLNKVYQFKTNVYVFQTKLIKKNYNVFLIKIMLEANIYVIYIF